MPTNQNKTKAHETAGCGRYTVTVEIEGFEPLMRRQIQNAKMPKFLDCSMYDSCYVECEVLESNVTFDISKHGSFFEKLINKSDRTDAVGYIIKYTDPFTDTVEQGFIREDRLLWDFPFNAKVSFDNE